MIAGIGFFLLDVCINRSPVQFLKDVSLFSFFFERGRGGVWYIGFSILAYLFAPLIFCIFRKNRWNQYVIAAAEILVILLFYNRWPEIYRSFHQTFTGMLVFTVGMAYGPLVQDRRKMNFALPGAILLIFFLKVLLQVDSNLLNGVVYSLLGISISVIAAAGLHFLSNEAICRFLRFFGAISLELYLVNHFLQSMIAAVYKRTMPGYMLVLLFGILLSIGVKKIENRIPERRR